MEFTIGRNIAAKGDKFIAAAKNADVLKLLGKADESLVGAIKKQTEK